MVVDRVMVDVEKLARRVYPWLAAGAGIRALVDASALVDKIVVKIISTTDSRVLVHTQIAPTLFKEVVLRFILFLTVGKTKEVKRGEISLGLSHAGNHHT